MDTLLHINFIVDNKLESIACGFWSACIYDFELQFECYKIYYWLSI